MSRRPKRSPGSVMPSCAAHLTWKPGECCGICSDSSSLWIQASLSHEKGWFAGQTACPHKSVFCGFAKSSIATRCGQQGNILQKHFLKQLSLGPRARKSQHEPGTSEQQPNTSSEHWLSTLTSSMSAHSSPPPMSEHGRLTAPYRLCGSFGISAA